VWYRMLINVHPDDYEQAVMDLCQNHKELGLINFVAEIKERSEMFWRNRQVVESRKARLLPAKDVIPPEKLYKLVKEFQAKMKSA